MVDSVLRGQNFASGRLGSLREWRNMRRNRLIQISSKRRDLHISEWAAIGGAKRGHERAGFAVRDPRLPELIVGRHFERVQIRHHCGAMLDFVTNHAVGLIKRLAIFSFAAFDVTRRAVVMKN